MKIKEEILKVIKEKGLVKTGELVELFDMSRQYISKILSELVVEKIIIKVGSTKTASYVSKDYLKKNPELAQKKYSKVFENKELQEHEVLNDIKDKFVPMLEISENIKSTFEYTFSEMLNNAIEHSESKKIKIEVFLNNEILSFSIDDFGIGVFRNIMKKRKLKSEMEAMRDLLKGKTTTAPKQHSGEGIFFTSKSGEDFELNSYGYQFIVDNKLKDVFIKKIKEHKRGTRVILNLDMNSKKHLTEVFRKYTNLTEESDYGFDKTEIKVKLYTVGGINVSRSQAKRVLFGLEKFKIIEMDYDKVPTVGQAFADEIYRVFAHRRPDIKLQNINMNKTVKFMVERAINEAKKNK